MSTLYELTGEMLELYNMADDADSDAEVIRIICDTLEGVEYEFDLKMEKYAAVIRNLDADMKAIKDEEARLFLRRKTIERNVDRMKQAMMEAMKATGKTKAGGTLFTVSVQKNGGKAPLVFADGITTDAVPDAYLKYTVDFDKEAIRKDLEEGKEVGFATLGERGESIRIK